MAFGDTITASDKIRAKLLPWLDNVPDFDDIKSTYKALGRTRAQIRILKRDIEDKEDEILETMDKPRSNETRLARIAATRSMKRQLAELEATEVILEMDMKFMEFHKAMYSSASFQSKQLLD